jgi:glycosyltransferase involved in cell wall biosynthesis
VADKGSLDLGDRNVSVIIPAYNVENTLRQCLNSVFTQSLQPREVIVVNDGSDDGTSSVCASFGRRIIYIEQKNQGQGAARNAGIRCATGRYIAFLDADDYWKTDFLSKCVDFLSENPDLVAVMTAWKIIFNKKTTMVVPPIMNTTLELKCGALDNFFNFWAEQDYVQTGAIMIRTKTIRKAGLQRPDLRNSQDLEYWALVATYGKWGFIPEVLYVNNSRMSAKGKWLKKYRFRKKLCPEVYAWEQRIIPRLKKEDFYGFKVIRGRVASAYAHLKILGGNYSHAIRIIQEYGHEMSPKRLNRFMKIGSRLPYPGWVLCCQIIRLKEIFNAYKLKWIG